MIEIEDPHPEFDRWHQGLKTDIKSGEYTDLEKNKVRGFVTSMIIDETFGNDAVDVQYSEDVNTAHLDPSIFQSVDKIKIQPRQDDELGLNYTVSGTLRGFSLDSPDLVIQFRAQISEKKGLMQDQPVFIQHAPEAPSSND